MNKFIHKINKFIFPLLIIIILYHSLDFYLAYRYPEYLVVGLMPLSILSYAFKRPGVYKIVVYVINLGILIFQFLILIKISYNLLYLHGTLHHIIYVLAVSSFIATLSTFVRILRLERV